MRLGVPGAGVGLGALLLRGLSSDRPCTRSSLLSGDLPFGRLSSLGNIYYSLDLWKGLFGAFNKDMWNEYVHASSWRLCPGAGEVYTWKTL